MQLPTDGLGLGFEALALKEASVLLANLRAGGPPVALHQLPLASLALKGAGCGQLNQASCAIVLGADYQGMGQQLLHGLPQVHLARGSLRQLSGDEFLNLLVRHNIEDTVASQEYPISGLACRDCADLWKCRDLASLRRHVRI